MQEQLHLFYDPCPHHYYPSEQGLEVVARVGRKAGRAATKLATLLADKIKIQAEAT